MEPALIRSYTLLSASYMDQKSFLFSFTLRLFMFQERKKKQKTKNKKSKVVTMMKKMIALLICLFLCGSAIAVGAASDDAALQKECQNDVQKVMTCLDFAKGSAARPSKECCNSMTDIRARDGKCLCFIIKETQGGQGGEMLKSLGVDKTKLLQLPSACQLKNASISDCPKLLGISPSSPDAAVFNSNVSTPTTSTSPGTKSSPDTAGNSNAAAKYGSNLVTPMTVTAMGVFAYGFPTGFASMIYSWV